MGTYQPYGGGIYLSNASSDDDDTLRSAIVLLRDALYSPEDTGPSYELSVRVYVAGHPSSYAEELDGVYREEAILALSLINEYFIEAYQVLTLGGQTGGDVHLVTVSTEDITHIHLVARLIERPNDEDLRRRNFRYPEATTPLLPMHIDETPHPLSENLTRLMTGLPRTGKSLTAVRDEDEPTTD